jgi:ATP-dependent Clp protease adapter protein ClpS
MYTFTNNQTGDQMKDKPRRARKLKLYLVNDSVNSVDHVIKALSTYVPFVNTLRAEQMATIAHNNGRCQIYHGKINDIFFIHAQLMREGLHVDMRK